MKVLVIEDDDITREAVEHCLISDGYEVVIAKDGEAGLEAWLADKFTLVCLDIMMPKMNGYDVCKKIRETDKATPILFLSAKREEIDIVLGLEMGADDFVGKPFGKHEFLARVKAAIRRSQMIRQQGLPADNKFLLKDLTVFPDELKASRVEGETIELTPREVKILHLLYSNKGKVVSRDTMLDQCWGVDYAYSRTLDTHIANLRKKIEISPSSPDIILTVRGIGYRYME